MKLRDARPLTLCLLGMDDSARLKLELTALQASCRRECAIDGALKPMCLEP